MIRPYTPRHNGKVERSHREDQKRFYSCHSFYSLEDFEKQLATHNRRANNLPMRPLHWLSPIEFACTICLTNLHFSKIARNFPQPLWRLTNAIEIPYDKENDSERTAAHETYPCHAAGPRVLLLLCACSAAPEPTQPAAEPPVETAETLPDHAAQDDAASEPAQPLFWQVSGNGYSGSFYLLGSIHVSDGLTYPQELLDAYAACDTLAVESDVLALEADLSAQVEMMRCLVYTDGTTIDAHLDAQTYADAKQVLTDLGGYQTMLDHYMPIFWYLLAGNLALAQTRFSPDGGVDRYFLQRAKADGTEILEVEQYTDVYRALGALSEETQVYALQQAIRPEVLAATEEDAAALLDAWCSGDEAAIIDLLEAEPDEPLTPEEEAAAEEFGRTLVTDRNAVMIRAADEALRAGKNVFYIVGIAICWAGRHCRGLRQRYTVTQVSYAS